MLLYLLSYFTRILQLLSCQIAIKGLITRLPCIVHGKLNLVENRYNNGLIIRRLTSLTRNECAITCVSDALCVMVNYKKDGTVCELVSSTDGSEIISNEWDIFKTDTGSDKLVCNFKSTYKNCQQFINFFFFFLIFFFNYL